MEQIYIKNCAKQLENKQDLLRLLNEIKKNRFGDKSYPFEMKQLNFYCNPTYVANSKRYHDFEIPKKTGGVRRISAPVNGLKSIQTCLNILFQVLYEPSSNAMGFAPNRSVVDNANLHRDQNYVYNIDLKDFFPSISQARIWGRLKVPPFNFNQQIASVIAGLCCMKVVTETTEKYILPQGAPTSPLLTNAVCDKLDAKLSKLARKYGLNYSRYADDITFSSMHNVYQKSSRFIKELNQIVNQQNFRINEKKTRLQKKGCRQMVTGLVVSNKVNVSREYVENLRNILYIWERYGYSVANHCYTKYYNRTKGYLKKHIPNIETMISGKLNYLKMVKGEQDSTYLKLKNQFDNIMSRITDEQNKETKYLETKSITEFETLLNTELCFKTTTKEKTYAIFKIDNEMKTASISKKARNVEKERLLISLCENTKKERYYLIHLPIPQHENISEKRLSISDLDTILERLCNSNFDLSVL